MDSKESVKQLIQRKREVMGNVSKVIRRKMTSKVNKERESEGIHRKWKVMGIKGKGKQRNLKDKDGEKI